MGLTMDDKYNAAARQLAREYESSIPREMKVAELPKALQTLVKQPIAPVKPNGADKTNMLDKPNSPAKSSSSSASLSAAKIQVEIVNASGNADAANKIATIFRGRGFEVTSVSNLANQSKNTKVISNTNDDVVLSKLTGLPFDYVLTVNPDESKSIQATVIIGKDYIGK
jgi:hypothetical protein